ncbi:uncharacterized protein LOC117405563 isoform X2 [Acipenser ruthenus]|uniref:uncharacterized protein LOC117405563 isoform X2 n=1 Tax=Acipenser ruthenus TaxID=7906 RepID=UPI0027412C4D|nr:uncharacterized protein LOC117405563 isoform X2 [Acipenser ruthenus]
MSCVHLALHQRQPCLLFIPQYCRRYCYHQTEAPGILLSSKVLQNRYSFSTRRKSNSSSATTSMVSELPEEPVCNAIPGVVYEYQPKYDYGISGDYYSVDQQRTLGEILTYCQVMYDAIRKLDQKFDQLQAKVTNVQAVHLGPSLLKKKPVVPPSTDVDEVHIQVSPEGNAGLTMPQQIQTCPPFFQHQVGAEQPDIVSPAPSVHSPSLVLPFQSPNQHSVHLHSIVSTDFTAQDPEPCHSIGEASRDHLLEEADVKARHKTKQVGQPSRRSCTSPDRPGLPDMDDTSFSIPAASILHTELIGDPGRKVTIPTNVLQKLSQKTNPRNTVRFLLRALFSIETLTCSNVMGDVGRGLSKLDPNKIAAMREWLVERFPSYDLREKGRDWRACISIINSAVRQMRFEARKLRKLQMNSTGQANPPGETPHNEKDEQREGDRTEEQPLGMVEAAEICVELESDSEEEYSSLPVLESPKLFSEESVEYLGNPMRGVRVAHSVMLAARQKRKPESAARFLIRHIFPDRVLLKSNVHGSKERGIPALDFSKISALREFLKEQFPEFKLNEDGYDWKVCVIAMNATIRRFRYDLQKFKRMTRADSR